MPDSANLPVIGINRFWVPKTIYGFSGRNQGIHYYIFLFYILERKRPNDAWNIIIIFFSSIFIIDNPMESLYNNMPNNDKKEINSISCIQLKILLK